MIDQVMTINSVQKSSKSELSSRFFGRLKILGCTGGGKPRIGGGQTPDRFGFRPTGEGGYRREVNKTLSHTGPRGRWILHSACQQVAVCRLLLSIKSNREVTPQKNSLKRALRGARKPCRLMNIMPMLTYLSTSNSTSTLRPIRF